MHDIGLTHIALQVASIDESVRFYARYAAMKIVHERTDEGSGTRVVWLSDATRPFALVLMESPAPTTVLRPFAHLGVGCATRADVDALCRVAAAEGALIDGPRDAGYPVGYWAFLRDPDGHTLELSHGQEIGLTVDAARAGRGSAGPRS